MSAYLLTSCDGCARPRRHNLQKDDQNQSQEFHIPKDYTWSEARDAYVEGKVRTLLSFPRLVVRLRREAEVGHLRALGQQPAHGRVVRHVREHTSSGYLRVASSSGAGRCCSGDVVGGVLRYEVGAGENRGRRGRAPTVHDRGAKSWLHPSANAIRLLLLLGLGRGSSSSGRLCCPAVRCRGGSVTLLASPQERLARL